MSQVLVEGAVQELAAVALMELIFNPKIRIGRMNTKLIIRDNIFFLTYLASSLLALHIQILYSYAHLMLGIWVAEEGNVDPSQVNPLLI